MKILYQILLAVFIIFTPLKSYSQTKATNAKWLVDTSHSNIGFTINHIFTPVRGIFEKYSSNIVFDLNNLSNSSIEVIIEVASINTNNQKRDDDLRSQNFFEVSKYPSIIFKSSEIKQVGNDTFKAVGLLTIKEISKNIELHFSLHGIKDHYRLDGYKMAGITAKTSINRTEFNVGTGDWVRTNIVGDEVKIDIALELVSNS